MMEEERKGLEAKVAQLEESLELMQGEFESMEDYWQRKLEEERVFYEEQLRSSERQFSELEARMREYEELVVDNRGMAKNEEEEEEVEGESLSEEDKLSTIEETGSLEVGHCPHAIITVGNFSSQVQVTEWEEEIACLRQQLEEQERSMDARMRACEEEWRTRLEAAEREEREARSRLEELRWRLREGDEQNPGLADYPSNAEESPRRVEAMVASSSSSSIVCSSSPRKDLEPSWVHQAATLPRCFSQSRLSSSSSSSFTTR